ncbi:hypothetical protein VNO80_09206 [Phaseolus coccineus]|uniref:Uncharacterized protein n=1 Tax=Phaseolus coccineus TaxID=3886 RepID=A0AAN9N691_PHACN
MFVKKLVEKASIKKFTVKIHLVNNNVQAEVIQKIYCDKDISHIVLSLDQEPWHLVRMTYSIPLLASYGNSIEESNDTVLTHVLPQPAAESQRSVKWIYAEGRASRLYDMGGSGYAPSNFLQVMLLNEHTESSTIKKGLHLSEGSIAIDMEIISTSSKQRQNYFILLGKSGNVYLYDDDLIERHLLQSQSKSTPSLPREVVVKLPLADSSITTAKFISKNPNVFSSADEVMG